MFEYLIIVWWVILILAILILNNAIAKIRKSDRQDWTDKV
jgi:hypothetical protein